MEIRKLDCTNMNFGYKLGQIRNFPAPTPKMRPYEEAHFMPESYRNPKGPLRMFVESMKKTLIEIIKASR